MARKQRGQSREAHWDVDRLIASFGGIAALIAAHAKLGFSPLTHGKISQWQRRKRVPADPLAEILLALKDIRRCNVWDYITSS